MKIQHIHQKKLHMNMLYSIVPDEVKIGLVWYHSCDVADSLLRLGSTPKADAMHLYSDRKKDRKKI